MESPNQVNRICSILAFWAFTTVGIVESNSYDIEAGPGHPDRMEVRDRLVRYSEATEAKWATSGVGIPPTACSLLSVSIPDSVASHILLFRNPSAIGGAIGCLQLHRDSSGIAESRAEAVYCACTGQWTTSYYAVLTSLDGEWKVVWDTTLPYALPGICPDTMRLGVEPDKWPTLSATGIVSAKGAAAKVLLQWDGKDGRVISPHIAAHPIAGDLIETVDIDGDGVMEIVVWIREDARGHLHSESVFRFDKARGSFEFMPDLVSGRRPPEQRNGVQR
ncbi:MAG TPA: hypothetical protein VNN55_10690 [bacterium]|nr:hypothetical protein [bacterium]